MAQTNISETSAVLNADLPIDAAAPVGPVLQMVNGVPMVSSHDVADHFGKRHADLLRSIKAVSRNSPEGWAERNFAFSEYEDSTGRKLPQADLTRDGFVVVAMGFTGQKAIKWKITYTEAFNAMEAELARQQAPAIPTGTITVSQQQELKELVQAKASAYPSQMYGRVISQIWTRLQRKFKVPRYSELPVAVFGEARDYVIAMQVRSVEAPKLPQGDTAKSLSATSAPITIRDYASVFAPLPSLGYWSELSRRLVQAHNRFQEEFEAIKKDALKPFREGRRIEVATFLDFATIEPYKRMLEIADDGQHIAYRGAYSAIVALEGLHDLLLRG